MSLRYFANIVAGFTLILSISVALAANARHSTYSYALRFSALAPVPVYGWEISDTPLGPTEWSSDQAAKMLNFSEYFYKTYQRGSQIVRIYAAYWQPGTIDPVLVNSHIPDVCWVAAGGLIENSDNHRVLALGNHLNTAPAAFRKFVFPQSKEQVVFWYKLGKSVIPLSQESSYTVFGKLRTFARLLKADRFGLAPQEQLFIRISTNTSIDEIVKTDLWPSISESLRQFGLSRNAD